MKTDARVRYTKSVLRRCLLELMRDKPIKKITVKEICEAAQLNRATFYTYYHDPYDLLEQIERELAEEITRSVESRLHTDDIAGMLTEILVAIDRNADLCQIIFSDHGDKVFLSRVLYTGHDEILARWRQLCPGAAVEQLERLYTLYANGGAAIIHRWVQTERREPPRELAVFLDRVCAMGLKALEEK